MSSSTVLYLRLLRKIVRESAWRLGGAEETFLAAGFGGDPSLIREGKALDGKAGYDGKMESVSRPGCGHQRERSGSA